MLKFAELVDVWQGLTASFIPTNKENNNTQQWIRYLLLTNQKKKKIDYVPGKVNFICMIRQYMKCYSPLKIRRIRLKELSQLFNSTPIRIYKKGPFNVSFGMVGDFPDWYNENSICTIKGTFHYYIVNNK